MTPARAQLRDPCQQFEIVKSDRMTVKLDFSRSEFGVEFESGLSRAYFRLSFQGFRGGRNPRWLAGVALSTSALALVEKFEKSSK